jgi:hypothetical protein
MCVGPCGTLISSLHPSPESNGQTQVLLWRRETTTSHNWQLACSRTVSIQVSSPSLSFVASPKEGGVASFGDGGRQKHQGVMLALNNMLGSRMPSTVVLELEPQEPSSSTTLGGAGRGKESWHSFSDMTGAFVPGGLVSIGSWQWCMEVCGFRKGTLKTFSKAKSLPHPTPGEGAVVSRMGVSADGLVVAIAVVDTDSNSRGQVSGCFFPTPGSDESMCVQESYIHVFRMNPRLVSGPEPLPLVTLFTVHHRNGTKTVPSCTGL